MSTKSIIIIGGGIAGLSCGCYARMNGYQSKIFEKHTLPGGLCTSWKRNGYTIDGCIHWMNGSGPNSNFHELWNEVGALEGKKIVNHSEFMRVVSPEGKTFILYTDIDRLEEHIKELSPEDGPLFEELAADMRQFCRIEMPINKPPEMTGILDNLKMLPALLPHLGLFKKYQNMTVQQFSQKIKNPFVRNAFNVLFDLPDFPMMAFMFTLTDMHKKAAGYPIGGSLDISRNIEKRYLALGGEIQYNASVQKILVENGKAVGLRLEDGSEARADIVISAADGHATIFDMLEGKYIDDEIRGYYHDLPIFEPVVMASFGVARDMSDVPHSMVYQLGEPIEIAGTKQQFLNVKHYAYDPTLAPQKKTVITSMFSSNYRYWKALMDEDPERYEAEKKDIAIKIINRLEEIHPGIENDIEMTDVATPLTFERYTGNWQGSYEGWLITPKTMKMMTGKGMRNRLPGLDNFYMIGQWVQPGGGLPSGLMSGRAIIQLLCHQDKKEFSTQMPLS